jgi:uncharacterized protein (DUF1330 family)
VILTGSHPPPDGVVIRFPDRKALLGRYASPAYQALIALRQQAADRLLLACEK